MQTSTRLSLALALAGLILGTRPATAQEPAPPPTVVELADALTAEGATVDTVEGLDGVDPWLLAYELCLRGKFDLAAAVAGHRESPDTARLPGFVEACRTTAPTDLREQLDAARNAETPEAAIAALEGIELKPDVASITAARLRLSALSLLRRYPEAAELGTRIADTSAELGWLRAQSAALAAVAHAYRASSRYPEALAAAQLRLDLDTTRKDAAGIGATHEVIATLAVRGGNLELAVEHGRLALAVHEELGDRDAVMGALNVLGIAYFNWERYDEAAPHWKRAATIAEELGDVGMQAGLMVNLGNLAKRTGDPTAAAEAYLRGAELAATAGNRRFEATAIGNLAGMREAQGRYREALELFARQLAMGEELRNPGTIASALANTGIVYASLGRYDDAIDVQTRALEIHHQSGDRLREFHARRSLGLSEMHRGANAAALAHFEQAVVLGKANRHAGQVMEALNWQTWVLDEMGATDSALAAQAEMESIARQVNHAPSIARALRLKAKVEAESDPARAIELFEEAEGLAPASDLDRQHLAVHYGSAGRHAESLELLLELQARLPEGASLDRAKSQVNVSGALRELGRLEEAVETAEQAVSTALEIGANRVASRGLVALSHAHFRADDHAEVVRAAKAAIELEPLLVTGLSENLAAKARESHSRIHEFGARAAGLLGDVEGAFHLLESARGIALLDSLGGRARIRGDMIPAELAAQEVEAQGKVREMRDRLQQAMASKKFKVIREAKAAHAAAQEELLEVVDRVQRTARAGAELAYPKAVNVAELQGALQPDEAYVGLALAADVLTAVVVTGEEARVVSAGDGLLVEGAADEFLGFARPGFDGASALDVLRTGLVEKLALPESVRRVLIVPVAQLAYVPFAVLMPDREVSYIPSGSTLLALRRGKTPPGEGVLGLGDPDYATVDAKTAANRGAKLLPLPGTRVEVEAIADVKLLGADANEAALLEAVEKKDRWRAIHLACHGLVHPSRPLLSSLALTRTDETDGFLTLHELFRVQLPADLVVLSACETAKGEVYFSEGVMGFPRAVMIAGAPRTIVSLWKVDDQATSALMRRFYELWNPKEGTGLSTAAALRAAQEHVRSQEAWSDPYYWAAWTLWGLPE